ncbi:MAG: 3' terminal RNA ribose 2'-O-methyltransferase Hen1 [Magnetococcales bacterium]|nr:3' terminal RNA ribose 2'-O-methyltransferase Hen1 [Magnetococcales bacterium]
MILSITNTHEPATDLGFLLHKHPERLYRRAFSCGTIHVFYPEAHAKRCTAVLYVELDPLELVRPQRAVGLRASGMEHYVNDRAYAASSWLSVAMAQAFSSAMNGHSKEKPELVEHPLPLEICLPTLPCRGEARLIKELFAPLGYAVSATRLPLDLHFPQWGESDFHQVRLSITAPLKQVLSQLYILIPVLDNHKHYWIDLDEMEKLLHRGKNWLAIHPLRELITRRYLKHQKQWTRQVEERLTATDPVDLHPDDQTEIKTEVKKSVSLKEERLEVVCQEIVRRNPTSVLDLGCGEGDLLRRLVRTTGIPRLTGVDHAIKSLKTTSERLDRDHLPETRRKRVTLRQGSLLYRDERLTGYDMAVLMEVVEHLDPARLDDFSRVLFGAATPATVLLTTPNREANARFPNLEPGQWRHPDHRFEWSRAEFQAWSQTMAERFGYRVSLRGIGEEDAESGSPTQMAIFEKETDGLKTGTTSGTQRKECRV